jgi:4-carboxymuconolactone decarboxylase
MRILLGAIAAAALIATATGQAKLPPDIDPESLSRLPLVKRADLDENGKRVYDLVSGPNRATPLLGPGGLSFYSPKVAEPVHLLNEYLRRESVIGSRYFELCALIAAREFDQQYEWTGHEPGGLRAGLDQKTIDVIKFNRDVAGLAEKDSVVIRMGRQLFRDHKVEPELYAKVVELFGRKGTYELSAVMGDYAMAAIMLSAADQHLPADRKPLLPDLKK